MMTIPTSTKFSTTDVGSTARCGEYEVHQNGGEYEVHQEGGEDEFPQNGGEYEVSHGCGVYEVPQDEVESEGLNQEGSVEEATAGDQLIEDPSLVEEDVKAGPSGEQPPVVVQQAAVCGGSSRA
jgi:hypothetical protein